MPRPEGLDGIETDLCAALEAHGWLRPRVRTPSEPASVGSAAGTAASSEGALSLHLVELLLRAEADSEQLCHDLDGDGTTGGVGAATVARRCHNLVQTALLFGGVELAATLGVRDAELPL